LSAILLLGLSTIPTRAQIDDQLQGEIKSSIDRATRYLWPQQEKDGSWRGDPGLTGLVVKAFSEGPRRYTPADGPFVREAVRFLDNSSSMIGSVAGARAGLAQTAQLLLGLESLSRPENKGLILRGRELLLTADTQDLESPQLRNLGFLLAATESPSAGSQVAMSTRENGLAQFQSVALQVNPQSEAVAAVLRLHLLLAREPAEKPSIQLALRSALNHVERIKVSEEPLQYHFLFFLANAVKGRATLNEGEPVLSRSLIQRILALQTYQGLWVNNQGGWQENDPVVATSLAVLALERLSNP